ncbi:MAG: phosphoribosylamine--glycine ligase [Actinomycetota bacterium]
MRVLLLGSGGRESALAWALARSSTVTQLYAAPGNPGIARQADLIALDPADAASAVDAARSVGADLVVVGPEAPLVAGVADALRADGRKVFGPERAAARIEGSKSYAKELMDRAGVPTARWETFDAVEPATKLLDELGPPYVVKADGLAAGKGVVVTDDRAAAIDALEERLVRGAFGDAGTRVVVEEYLDGPEASLIAFVDGNTALACEVAQDYKRIYDDDEGPNTGGMGSYSPVPACPSDLADRIVADVIDPMVVATRTDGAPFVGALYAGLALTSRGPRVVEFNVRFGDPETQALLPRLRSDLAEVALAAASGELAGAELEWTPQACVSVVLAPRGYPGPHETGHEIAGLDALEQRGDVFVFQAGTARRNRSLVTSGGRVLAVSALGNGFGEARRRAYDAADSISFEGKHMRRYIARRAEGVGSERSSRRARSPSGMAEKSRGQPEARGE